MSQEHPNWTRTLVLAALLAAFGGGAYWLEYSHRPKREKEEVASKKPFPLDGKSVSSITLAYGTERTFSFRCLQAEEKKCRPGDDTKWMMDAPIQTASDHGNVNSLVGSLNNLEVEETISLKDDSPEKRAELLKEYGLSPEALAKRDAPRVELGLEDGKKRVVRLGGTHPIGGKLFALLEVDGKLDQETVWLLPPHARNNLEHDLTYWREKRLFTTDMASIESFALSGKGSFAGEKRDGAWTLRAQGSKDALPGDLENVEVLLSSLAFLNAKAFPAAKEASGAGRVVRAEFTTAKKEKTAVELLEKAGKQKRAFARVAGRDALYEIDPSAITRIAKSMKDLRLTRLMPSMERFNVKSLVFTGKAVEGGEVKLTNRDAKWYLGQDAKEEADGEKIQRFLDDLTGPRIRDFVPAAKAPGDRASGMELATETRKLRFWKSGKKLYAEDLLSKRGEAYELDGTLLASLPWMKDHFRKK